MCRGDLPGGWRCVGGLPVCSFFTDLGQVVEACLQYPISLTGRALYHPGMAACRECAYAKCERPAACWCGKTLQSWKEMVDLCL